MIWRYTISTSAGRILIDSWAFPHSPISTLSPTFIPPICRVNRQLKEEVLQALLTLSKFRVTSCGRIPFMKWLATFPNNDGFAAVRHLDFSDVFSGYWKSQLSLTLQCVGLRTVEMTFPLQRCVVPPGMATGRFPMQRPVEEGVEEIVEERQLGELLRCEKLEWVVLEFCTSEFLRLLTLDERERLDDNITAVAEWLEEGFWKRGMNTFVLKRLTGEMYYGTYYTVDGGS
ncbi:hypothetical protein BU16DRAFT_583740 [Lophium mytilinum]|uniref:Uncharacterized protein n=1 Tax=Lophium mytilinum TaxID=390894 RepID=A0A6A6QJH6_9PEZI|nr:hypothetical protein BU16DRAFT_583740 [Lophium mytilinum]